MHRIITIPIQIILGLVLMKLFFLHLEFATFWLIFMGIVLCGSIIGSAPKKRRTAQDDAQKP